ncbi:LapA family protein [Nocardioides ungokensis]|uniref:LapA family protein n=1 Tax=Nocardioides ungokensis TaxID=1643322 RepID=UPI0015E0529C|nr:LapA family protein [Nocardioides ungokensis]
MSNDSPTPVTPPDRAAEDTRPDTRPDNREAPTEPAPASASRDTKDPLRGSRTSGIWVAVVGLGLVLLLLVVFIAQNTQSVSVSFLGWSGQTPLAVALLIATAAGLFLAAVAGSLRILQLRRRVRREARH